MGFSIKSITKPVSKAVKSVAAVPKKAVNEIKSAANKIENKVIEPIVQAPGAAAREIGRGVDSIGDYPGKILATAGGAIGSGVGNVVEGLTPALNGITPIADQLLGTFARGGQPVMNPSEYVDRKQDYTTPPIITLGGGSQGAGFDFSSIMPLIIAGGIGLLIFIFVTKRK